MNTLDDSINQYAPAIRLYPPNYLTDRRCHFYASEVLQSSTLWRWRTSELIFLGGEYYNQLLGMSLLFGAVWLEQMLTYGYHNSYYFQD